MKVGGRGGGRGKPRGRKGEEAQGHTLTMQLFFYACEHIVTKKKPPKLEPVPGDLFVSATCSFKIALAGK